MTEELKKKVEEQLDAGKEEKEEPAKIETPLEEVKRIAEETKKTAEMNKENLAKMEEIQANLALSGRAQAGMPVRKKTQEDIDKEDADKMLSMFQ